MNAENNEADFVKTFVRPAKRARYAALLRSSKNRKKIVDRLNHWHDLDTRFASRIPPSQQNARAIANVVRAKGAGRDVHVISSNPDIDGHSMPLDAALDATIGMGYGTVIICIPGRLAYFESEDPGERYILERAAEAAV